MEFPALEAQDYFFEVFTDSTLDNVQKYRVDVTAGTLLGISASAPTFIEPGVENTFQVTLNPLEQTVEPGSELLYYRSEPGSFTSVPLVPLKGNDYLATLPPFACDPDAEIEYYMEAALLGSSSVTTLPIGGPDAPFTAFVGQPSAFFHDNFQADLMWNITGTVSGQLAGEWERGVPAGDGSRGDPTTDADGSGSCYLTGNGGPGSNTDVDGENTILNSPIFDVSNINRPGVSYWRWYDNTGSGIGSGPGEDVFTVEVSDDGGMNWFVLEVVGPETSQSAGGWFFVEHDLISSLSSEPDFDTATSQLQLRFIASDELNASVIEAAVDGVSVTELLCQDPNPVISLAMEPAESVLPGEDYVFEVLIDEIDDAVVPGSEMLAYLPASPLGLGGGEFIFVPLVSNGGNSYTATIPAQNCNPNHHLLPEGASDVSYYMLVEGVNTGVTTFPDLHSEALLGLNIGEPVLVREDNFELDTGWTVSGGAKSPLDGMWERGVPLGDGSSGDPTADADGSGSCFVTGNTDAATNSDVDTLTMLNSPIFDISDLIDPRIVYYRWYDNTGGGTGGSPGNDVMEVGVSYDGGQSFDTLDTIGPNTADSIGGWIQSDLSLDSIKAGTSTMQIRFLLADQGQGSIIEAGIDGVTITGLACESIVACPADLNGDGSLNFLDVSAFLSAFGSGDPVADFSGDGSFNFLDVSAFLAAFGAGCP